MNLNATRTFAQNMFEHAGGDPLVSADGSRISRRLFADDVSGSLAWAREGFLGLGFSWGGNVHVSRDLVEWNKISVLPGPSLQAVAYGKP